MPMRGRDEAESVAVAASEELWETTEGWARTGDADRIAAVARVLAEQRAEAERRLGELDRNLAHTLRTLALTPGRPFMRELLGLLGQDGRAPTMTRRTGPRLLASLIAGAQSLEDAAHVMSEADRSWGIELRAALFHELLLRGENADGLYRLAGTSYLIPEWHALAWLPDRLAEMEWGAEFCGYGYRTGGGAVLPDPPVLRPVRSAERRAATDHGFQEATSPHAAEAIGGPPRQWGNHEARVFVRSPSSPGLDPADLPAVLTRLPMDCVAGLDDLHRFEADRRPLDEVWATLFATAAAGGLHASGVHGAFGRLVAWRSIAGLAGAGRGASAAEVERLAEGCTWFRFEADSEWFHNEIHDYGIAALAPGGRRIAVLAATDTD